MEELPNGDYIAFTKTSKADAHKWWYVKADGSETVLPINTDFPLRHPGMALFYQGAVNNFIVQPSDEKAGYICDKNGVEVGNLKIEDYYNSQWEVEPVKSSYYRINVIDKKKKKKWNSEEK